MATSEVGLAQRRMWRATRNWIAKLKDYPGWREWNRSRIGHTFYFDDKFARSPESLGDFQFDYQTELEHIVVTRYLELLDAVASLRDIEWYFRRYPFTGTSVTRYTHLTHCCELYFGRFYQFKERLKNLFDAVKVAVPDHGLDVGRLIKQFDRNFKDEILARNTVHHRERFDDIAISRVFLTESILSAKSDPIERRVLQSRYRVVANEWTARIRRRAKHLDAYVEAVAEALLNACKFLDDSER